MLKRFLRAVLMLLVLGGIPVSAGYWHLRRPLAHPEAVVTIEPGASVGGIAAQLARAGVIPRAWPFVAVVRLTGAGRALKAGEYVLPDGLSLLDIYRKLLRGEFRVFRITIPEGWTMREIAEYLGRQPFAPPGFAEAFLVVCRDADLIAALGIAEAATLEGYLFPETYEIRRPKQAREVAERLAREFQKRFTPAMRERARALGMSVHQAVTLAAIIEKETGAAAERPLVSSVFHNRLAQGMALASDPTVIYGLPHFDGNLRKADLANPHRYNTYAHPGLPPGPIANPGLAALAAALNPAQTDYLYFVSRNNGTHAFATTYAEHARNVRKYQVRREKD